MFLFVIFAAYSWFLAFRHRRRWRGGLVLLCSMLLVGLVGYFHWMLNRWTGGRIYLPVLQILLYPYGLLVLAMGIFLVVQPRRALYECRRCHYDLRGLVEEGLYSCPECGRRHAYLRDDSAGHADRCPSCRRRQKHLAAHDRHTCDQCHATVLSPKAWMPARELPKPVTIPEAPAVRAQTPERGPRAKAKPGQPVVLVTAGIAPAVAGRVRVVAAELRSTDFDGLTSDDPVRRPDHQHQHG